MSGRSGARDTLRYRAHADAIMERTAEQLLPQHEAATQPSPAFTDARMNVRGD